MGLKEDRIFEWLSNHLPFGNGKAHTKFLEYILDNKEIKSLLDIGCGRGVYKVFRKFDSIGIDIFPENIRLAKENGNYKEVIEADINNIEYKENSFDAIVCIDVIEHIDKASGEKLLEKIERIAKKIVIVNTAWGYQKIPKRNDNVYLNHLCGWWPNEFEERGYKIYPFKALRWNLGNSPILLMLSYVLSVVLRPIISKYPEKYCNDFAAVKRMV